MAEEYIVVADDQSVYKDTCEESEIQNMIESGFISAVLRVNNKILEYANVDHETGNVTWTEPVREK